MFMEHLGMGMEWSIAIRLQVGNVEGFWNGTGLSLFQGRWDFARASDPYRGPFVPVPQFVP
jgi:hypothetical protein